ncbi:hypothetical protein V1504DRAFT_437855 [Lipomyces starkeyi]
MPMPQVAKVFAAHPRFTLCLIPELTGKSALVTGGTSECSHAGATVYVTSRSLSRAQKAVDDIVNNGPDNRTAMRNIDVRALQLDLDNIKAAATVAGTLLRDIPALDILVANAGNITREKKVTADCIESQFAACHVGHFVLVLTLLPAIEKAGSRTGDARIVILANMLLMHSLSARLSSNVRVNACHPGAVISNFNDGLFADGNDSRTLRLQLAIFKKFFMVPAATAALGTVVFLAAGDKIKEEDVRAGYFWPVATRKDEWASKWALDAGLQRKLWQFTVRIAKKAGVDIE